MALLMTLEVLQLLPRGSTHVSPVPDKAQLGSLNFSQGEFIRPLGLMNYVANARVATLK